MLSKLRRLLGITVATGLLVAVAPAPAQAQADTFYLHILNIYCADESEPFSDEIRLRFTNLGIGGTVAGWNNVDGGDTHWYYSSIYNPLIGPPLNLPFSGDQLIEVMEEDGGLELIGYVPVSQLEAGQGQKRKRMLPPYDGDYYVTYEVTS